MGEEQRQRELERYYYEQEQRQLMKQREEELRRRKMMEAEHRRRLEMERMRRRQQEERYFDDDSITPTIVRGTDGRLYRLVPTKNERPVDLDIDQQPQTSMRNQNLKNTLNKGTDKKSSTPERPSKFQLRTGDYNTENEEGNNGSGVDSLPHKIANIQGLKPTKSKSKNRRRIVITVEDASDSEAEDEYNSKWRNRRPAPGESWMEPIHNTIL